jgi:hypothetical protein
MELVDTSTWKKLYIFIIASIRTQYFYSTWVFWISRGCLCNRYEPCAIHGKHGGSAERWTPWLVEVVSCNEHYKSCITQKCATLWVIKWRIYDHVMQFICVYVIQVLHYPHKHKFKEAGLCWQHWCFSYWKKLYQTCILHEKNTTILIGKRCKTSP